VFGLTEQRGEAIGFTVDPDTFRIYPDPRG